LQKFDKFFPDKTIRRLRVLQKSVVAERTPPRAALHKNDGCYFIGKIDGAESFNTADLNWVYHSRQ